MSSGRWQRAVPSESFDGRDPYGSPPAPANDLRVPDRLAVVLDCLTVRVQVSAVLIASLVLHLLVMPRGDFVYDTSAMRRWAAGLLVQSPVHFFDLNRGVDHLPGDLLILWGVAHLYAWVTGGASPQSPSFLTALKLVPIAADVGIAAMLYLIGTRLGGWRSGRRAALLFAVNPGPVFLAAFWGQWDAVSMLVALVSLWFLLAGSLGVALPVLAYAVTIKPPFAAFIPIFIVFAARRTLMSSEPSVSEEPRSRHGHSLRRFASEAAIGILASAALVAALGAAFGIGAPLWGRQSLIDRMQIALDAYPKVTLNAFNLWGAALADQITRDRLVSDRAAAFLGLPYHTWGLLLTTPIYAALLTAFALRGDERSLVLTLPAVTFTLFMLPTRVHERYLFPTVAFSALAAAVVPGLRWFYGALSAAYLANLVWVYDQNYHLSIPEVVRSTAFVLAISLANLGLLLFLLARVLLPGGRMPGRMAMRGTSAIDYSVSWRLLDWRTSRQVGKHLHRRPKGVSASIVNRRLESGSLIAARADRAHRTQR